MIAIKHCLVVATALGVVGLAGCSDPAAVGLEGPLPAADIGNSNIRTLTPTPAGPADSIGDGIHEVLVDVAAGKYRTIGPRPGGIGMCFWYRLSGTGGTHKEILASGTAYGPVTVTLYGSDKAFRTEFCAPWVRIGDAP